MAINPWLWLATYLFLIAGGMGVASWLYSAHRDLVRRLHVFGFLFLIAGVAVVGAGLVSG
jgi:hypothetical protein